MTGGLAQARRVAPAGDGGLDDAEDLALFVAQRRASAGAARDLGHALVRLVVALVGHLGSVPLGVVHRCRWSGVK